MKNIMKKFVFMLTNLTRIHKLFLILILDTLAIIITLLSSYYLRTNEYPLITNEFLLITIFSVTLLLSIFFAFGLYRQVLRYSNVEIIITSSAAMMLYALLFAFIITFVNIHNFPRTLAVIHTVLMFSYTVFVRIMIKRILNSFGDDFYASKNLKRIMIYGTQKEHVLISRIAEEHTNFKFIGFIEEDSQLVGRMINNNKIYSSVNLENTILKNKVNALIISFDNLNEPQKIIINELIRLGLSIYNTSQFLHSLIGSQHSLDFNNLDTLTLIGRKQIVPDASLLKSNIFNKVILITGAGGSIGSELARQIYNIGPSRLILIDNSEFSLYKINYELSQIKLKQKKSIEVNCFLGSVNDMNRMEFIMKLNSIDTVYHAAAYKHVTLVENNPEEAIKVNVFGTKIICNLVNKYKIRNFVLVSTDKAVNPSNVMGATKKLAELIIQVASRKITQTKFSIVRFGNVIGSSGSVIPKFAEQIKNGGPVTVTHKKATRYFMTIPEASQLIIQASSLSEENSLFVLEMGDPINIFKLAERMIRLSGCNIKNFEQPFGEIEIIVTGLSSGEKMHEELSLSGKFLKTKHPRIKKIKEDFASSKNLDSNLKLLEQLVGSFDEREIMNIIKKMIAEFKNF